jgi:hypothetical protein
MGVLLRAMRETKEIMHNYFLTKDITRQQRLLFLKKFTIFFLFTEIPRYITMRKKKKSNMIICLFY